nr:hypothetical protein [uncultured Moellerella sp.]
MKNELINKQNNNQDITALNDKFAGTDQAIVALYKQAYNENIISGKNLKINMLDVSSANRGELISKINELNDILPEFGSSTLSEQTSDEILQDDIIGKKSINPINSIIENTNKTEANNKLICSTDVLNNLSVTQFGIKNEDAVLLPKNESFTGKIAVYSYSTLR